MWVKVSVLGRWIKGYKEKESGALQGSSNVVHYDKERFDLKIE
ncbi:hypothetical protein [Wolbachia endosymbiont of Folsomia candida]|nr:hypothetical protein [Wolbachia endosymbiont of Folsomia candida]